MATLRFPHADEINFGPDGVCPGADPLNRQVERSIFQAFALCSAVVNEFAGGRLWRPPVNREHRLLQTGLDAQDKPLLYRQLAGEFVFIAFPRKAQLAVSCNPDIAGAVGRIAFKENLSGNDLVKNNAAFQKGTHLKL